MRGREEHWRQRRRSIYHQHSRFKEEERQQSRCCYRRWRRNNYKNEEEEVDWIGYNCLLLFHTFFQLLKMVVDVKLVWMLFVNIQLQNLWNTVKLKIFSLIHTKVVNIWTKTLKWFNFVANFSFLKQLHIIEILLR